MPLPTDKKLSGIEKFGVFKPRHFSAGILKPDGIIHFPQEFLSPEQECYHLLLQKYDELLKEHLELLRASNEVLTLVTRLKTMTSEQLQDFLDNKSNEE